MTTNEMRQYWLHIFDDNETSNRPSKFLCTFSLSADMYNAGETKKYISNLQINICLNFWPVHSGTTNLKEY